MDSEQIYKEIKESRKKDKIEIKVYLNRDMASLFKAIAIKDGKTRSRFIGDVLTEYLKQTVV